jgi:hypothetical protein
MSTKNQCPSCGGLKKTTSKICSKCRYPAKVITLCLNCNKETTNPSDKMISNRRKPEHKCKVCETPIGHNQRYCSDDCKSVTSMMNNTMCHYNQIKGNGKYNSIRAKARILYQQSQKPYVCYNCGYDKHVQICHLKPLHLFADDTLISIVNDLNNLIALCPNCHWELDNNILSLPAIGESNS